MTFNKVWDLTSTISSETAFSCPEGEALYRVLLDLDPGSSLVEVGCEFGRSTSILAQMAKLRNYTLYLIDPFVTPEAAPTCVSMLRGISHPFTLFCMTTEQIKARDLPDSIALLHIDGDHQVESLMIDCERLLPKVLPGGYAAFHDYGRESLPTVYSVVNRFMDEKWRVVTQADTLGIWQKLAQSDTLDSVSNRGG